MYLGVLQSDVMIPAVEINLPNIAVLIDDNKLKK